MENSITRNEQFIMKLLEKTQKGHIKWERIDEKSINISREENIIGNCFRCSIQNNHLIIYQYEHQVARISTSNIYYNSTSDSPTIWVPVTKLSIIEKTAKFPDWSVTSDKIRIVENLYRIIIDSVINIDSFIDNFINQ